MAPRQIKMPGRDNSDKEAEEVFSQRKRPEKLLQVDKQTKSSYKTPEAAQSAALEIKIAARRGLVLFFLASHAAAPILHSRYGARS